MKEARELEIKTEQCDRDIKTYGDVIRHMSNWELAIFLEEIQAEIELGILAVMRAKMYPHRYKGEEPVMNENDRRHTKVYHFERFMEHRLKEEDENYGDVWGVKNWQDLMQWESQHPKNFGMDVVY